MAFQWLQMRITEETERREREAQILDRLPRALDELQTGLAACIDAYTAAFGSGSATLTRLDLTLRIAAQNAGAVEIEAKVDMPGFEIRGPAVNLAIEVGLLPGDRLFYRDRERDQYLTKLFIRLHRDVLSKAPQYTLSDRSLAALRSFTSQM